MLRRFPRALVVVVLFLISATALAGHRFSASAYAAAGGGKPAVAMVALPPAGGEESAVAGPYDDGFVRFSEARTLVRGVKEGDIAVTTTEVVLIDFHLGDRIHADRVIVRTNGRQDVDAAEPAITFEGSAIENLTIDGVAMNALLDTAYFDARPTFASLKADVATHGGTVTCSAFNSASCGQGRRGIRIVGLGFLVIGEVFVKEGARYIEMLRLERGGRPGELRPTGDGGPSSAGWGGGNGAPSWP